MEREHLGRGPERRSGLAASFFSPAETAWFGLEHLNFGYRDFTRLPNAADGVWLKPFEEGKPGVQPERIPPYVCTLNPGWDPGLPLYKPLPMFEAQKAAQAPGAPQPCPWDRKAEARKPAPPAVPATIEVVAFAGSRDGELHKRLAALGVPLAPVEDAKAAKLLIVDAETLTDNLLPAAQRAADATLAGRGTVLLMFRRAGEVSPALKALLPASVTLTPRRATALVPRQGHAWTAGLGLADLYCAEDAADKHVVKCGLDGPLVRQGRVLLEASNTDWSLFIDAPENAKCAAVVLHEQLAKPSGAALVTLPHRDGTIGVCAVDCVPTSAGSARFWHALLTNMGVRFGPRPVQGTSAQPGGKAHDLLLDGPP